MQAEQFERELFEEVVSVCARNVANPERRSAAAEEVYIELKKEFVTKVEGEHWAHWDTLTMAGILLLPGVVSQFKTHWGARGVREVMESMLEDPRRKQTGLGSLIYYGVILPFVRHQLNPDEGPAARVFREEEVVVGGSPEREGVVAEKYMRSRKPSAATEAARREERARQGEGGGTLTMGGLRAHFEQHFTPYRPQDQFSDHPLKDMRRPQSGENEIDYEEWFHDLGGGAEATGVIEKHNEWFGKGYYSVTSDTLEGIVNTLPTDKSCGIDGGDNEWIKGVFGGQPKLVKEVLTKFANAVLAGRASPGALQLWNATRLVMFEKEGRPGEFRPIEIPNALDRLISRGVEREHGNQETLGKYQYGGGRKGGIDILSHGLQSVFEEGRDWEQQGADTSHDLLNLDATRAYTTIYMRAVREALAKYDPRSIRYFLVKYANTHRVYNGRGGIVGVSARMTQGHPNSSRYFAITTRDPLERVNARIRDLHPDGASVPNRWHGAGAYEDDTHFIGDLERVLGEVKVIEGEYEGIGVRFNSHKSTALTVTEEGSERWERLKELAEPLGITISSKVVKTLGFQIGEKVHVEKALRAQLDRYKVEMRLKDHFHSEQDQFAVLNYCLSAPARASHLTRATHPSIGDDVFRELDDAAATAVLDIAGVKEGDTDQATLERAKKLALLPGEVGGAGPGRVGGVRRTTRYAQGLHSTLEHFKDDSPGFLATVAERRAGGGLECEVCVVEKPEGEAKGPWGGYEEGGVPHDSIKWEEREMLPVDVEGAPTTDRKATIKALKEANRNEDIAIATRLLEEMRLPANKFNLISAASMLSGATSEAAMFLRYVGGPVWGRDHIEGQAFAHALRYRLLLPPIIGSPDGIAHNAPPCKCLSCARPPPSAPPADQYRPHRALYCKGFMAQTNDRHNKARDLFARHLRKIGPTRIEQRVADGMADKRRSDVECYGAIFEGKGSRMMLDVVITTPSTPTMAEDAAHTAGWAAAKAERLKFDKYWRKANPNRQAPLEGTRVRGLVPVAVETGGRVGGEARRWLRRVFRGEPESLQALYRELSFLRARKVGETLWMGSGVPAG